MERSMSKSFRWFSLLLMSLNRMILFWSQNSNPILLSPLHYSSSILLSLIQLPSPVLPMLLLIPCPILPLLLLLPSLILSLHQRVLPTICNRLLPRMASVQKLIRVLPKSRLLTYCIFQHNFAYYPFTWSVHRENFDHSYFVTFIMRYLSKLYDYPLPIFLSSFAEGMMYCNRRHKRLLYASCLFTFVLTSILLIIPKIINVFLGLPFSGSYSI